MGLPETAPGWKLVTALLLLAVTTLACGRPPAREYELIGQVLSVDASRQEVTVKHGDIRGFMPGMTMPFKVRDAGLLNGRVPGDMVKATLVVEDNAAYLRTLDRIGHEPVSETTATPAPRPIERGEPVADAELVDDAGAPLRLSQFRGSVVAVTFTYTRCPMPNFCPLIDRHFKQTQDLLAGDAALKGHARLVSVTLDPAFDTPAVLAAHGAALGADRTVWRFATGAAAAVASFGSQFGVSAFREQPDAIEVVHNLRTAVIDREGRLSAIFNGGEWTSADLVTAMRAAY